MTVDPYINNALRVLGAHSNTSAKQAARGADRLLKWIELGEAPQVVDLFPYLGLLRRDREAVKKASKDIEDPRMRIASELYWPSAEFAALEDCQELLRTCQYRELISLCEKAIADGFAGRKNALGSDPRLNASLGCHFLAIFFHSAAIAASVHRGTAPSLEELPSDWESAFRYWSIVIKDDIFWAYLVNRAISLNDPRLDGSYVHLLKQGLPLSLLRVNVSRAIASAERDQFGEFVLNCTIIQKAQFGSDGERALREIVAPLQSRFEKSLQEIQAASSESTIRIHVPMTPQTKDGAEPGFDPEKLTPYLAGIEDSVKKRLLPIGTCVREAGLHRIDFGSDILDGIAYAYRSISLAFNNHARMPRASLRLTAAAMWFAEGPECKARLAEDYQALQCLALQQEAIEFSAQSRYKESLAKLQEARQFASSQDERGTIDEWIESAKKRIAFDGVKKIASPPTMFTFNGIGTRLYGRRNYDAVSQTYVATLYFTFIFLPILPLAAYRVKNAGGRHYQFLGKVPLKASAFIVPAIAVALIGFLMLQDNTQSGTSTRVQSASPSSVEAPSSSVEAPSQLSNNEKQNLGQWIEQERVRLKDEETELGSDRAQIETDRRVLDQRIEELNAGSPSQEDVDTYEADRRRFNERVRDYNARLTTHHSDATAFNAQVNRYNSMP